MIDDPFGLTDEMDLSLLFDGRSLMKGTDLLAFLQEIRLCLDEQEPPEVRRRQLEQLERRLRRYRGRRRPLPQQLELEQLGRLVSQLCKI